MSENTRLRLLIVEDNKSLAENLFEYLGEEKYLLDYAADGLTALHLLATQSYDIIILDIMLPGVDGLTICKRIRQDLKSSTPILLLTARDAIEDKEQGFNNGADDYLVKPFHMRELELRLHALRRRKQTHDDCIQADGISYYPGTLTVVFENQQELILSGYSATIFETLIRSFPRFSSYAALSDRIWKNNEADLNTLRTHVYTLRKLLKARSGQDLIKTLHGRGYSLAPTQSSILSSPCDS